MMFSNLRTRISHKPSAAHGGVRNLTVVGQGKISLSSSDFAAHGGEGSVYVKGAFAYKLYHDPSRAIKPAKISELSVLSNHNVIRPLAALVDRNGIAVGYSMKSIPNSLALCRLFPKAFRIRNNVTPGTVFDLVSKLQAGIIHIHSKNILIVDLNEMNFVVGENLSEIYFIDVDSYQTLSFPATVLMESVRDRHSRSFSRETDWFSFAIVSFQMFTGIHPYKGTYEPFAGIMEKTRMLDERMKAN